MMVEKKTAHVVRDKDGNVINVADALNAAIAEELGDDEFWESDGDMELREGGRQTGEMKVLLKMVKKGKFSPRTEYEMGACQMLKIRGYATTSDNARFHPTAEGKAKARELKPSLRFGKI